MKRLIVNADDFGLTRGVNQAIAECYQRGIVSSTTLMANSAQFTEAAAIAKSLPLNSTEKPLSVGCHVVLADGEPVLPPAEVASLLAPGTNRFYRSVQDLARMAVLNRFQAAEIEAEAIAQFRKIQAAGLSISHFDTHKHAHLFPSVLGPLLKAAAICGVRAIRNPFEPVFSMPFPTLLRIPVRYAEVLALRAFRRKFHAMVAESGLRTTDGSLGLVATGTLTVRSLVAMLGRMQDGLWELVCHPGYNDAELANAGTRLLASRETEMQALTAQSTRDALERNGVRLVTFPSLVGDAPASAQPGFESHEGSSSSNQSATTS